MRHVRGAADAARRHARALQRGYLPSFLLAAHVAPVGSCANHSHAAFVAHPCESHLNAANVAVPVFRDLSDEVSLSGACEALFCDAPVTDDAKRERHSPYDPAPASPRSCSTTTRRTRSRPLAPRSTCDVGCQTYPVLYAVPAEPAFNNTRVLADARGTAAVSFCTSSERQQFQLQIALLSRSFAKLTDHVNDRLAAVAMHSELEEMIGSLHAPAQGTTEGLKGTCASLFQAFVARSHGGMAENLTASISSQSKAQADSIASEGNAQLKHQADTSYGLYDQLSDAVAALQLERLAEHFAALLASLQDPAGISAFHAALGGDGCGPPFAAEGGAIVVLEGSPSHTSALLERKHL